MPLADADKKHFQVVVKGTYAAGGLTAQATANVFYYRRSVFTSDLDYTELTTALHATFKAVWKLAVSASWTWAATDVRNIDSPTEGGSSTNVAEVGAVAGDPLPPFVAMLISKRTGRRGKSFRGRFYIAGIAESGTANSELTAGQKTLLDNLAAVLDDSVTTAAGLTYVPFLLSSKNSDLTIEPATVVGVDITSCLGHTQVASMVSRRVHSS